MCVAVVDILWAGVWVRGAVGGEPTARRQLRTVCVGLVLSPSRHLHHSHPLPLPPLLRRVDDQEGFRMVLLRKLHTRHQPTNFYSLYISHC